MCCFLPIPVKHPTVDFTSNDIAINLYIYVSRCMGLWLFLYFTFSIFTLTMLNMLFTNLRVLKLMFFSVIFFDSRGSGLSKVSKVMSSQQTARTSNTINILQDKWYILSQEKKNATGKHNSPAIPLC